MATPNNTKIKRVKQTGMIEDQSSVDQIAYSRQIGGHKVMTTGSNLSPLYTGSSYVTDASSGITLPNQGCLLAVYNNSSTAYAITMGTNASTVSAALAIGVTDANGNVGIPCPVNTWTYLSCFTNQYIITNNALLKVFLVNDDTAINSLSG